MYSAAKYMQLVVSLFRLVCLLVKVRILEVLPLLLLLVAALPGHHLKLVVLGVEGLLVLLRLGRSLVATLETTMFYNNYLCLSELFVLT